MNFFLVLLFLGVNFSHSKALEEKQILYQKWVLEAVSEIPPGGGYELTTRPAETLRDSFSWVQDLKLVVDPSAARPSHCTSATYLVFFKVLEKFWNSQSINPDKDTLLSLKPNLEPDGEGTWGRWNANGPGTAKFFYDLKIGINFDDIAKAIPGDFIKIFWNEHVGKLERGHTAIYLGQEVIGGEAMLRFWASSKSTQGFSEKVVPLKDARKLLFSRLTNLGNLTQLSAMAKHDPFLASMLERESSWEELRRVTGIEELKTKKDHR